MLRLPRFAVASPTSLDELVELMKRPGARVLAGGTDLLPNLKHRFEEPELLVSLTKLPALGHIEVDDGVLRVGALATLTEIAESSVVEECAPSFAGAAGLVASPLIRNMGTIGGNLNLDTRCRYINQSEFWRTALGGCLKSHGSVCHVVPKGRNCVAAMSSDCVPVLISLDGSIALVGPNGAREVSLAEYYNTDGIRHVNREPDEVMTELRVPLAPGPQRAIYQKWTVRKSIDFPLVSIALRFDLEEDSIDAPITRATICIGVLAAKPKLVKRTERVVGLALSDARTTEILCDLVRAQGKPLPNVPYDSDYRQKMLPVYTRRAIETLLSA